MQENNFKNDKKNSLEQPQKIKQNKFLKKRFVFMGIGIIMLFLFVFSDYFPYKDILTNNIQIFDNGTERKAKEEAVEILYTEKEKILETVKLQSGTDTEASPDDYWEWKADIYDFYKIGTVNSGQYKNGDLLLVFFKPGGPCKGPSCDKPIRLRYIKKDNVIIFLPRISYPLQFRNNFFEINPFKKFGFDLEVDANFTVTNLEYLKEIEGPEKRQILIFSGEEDGRIDLSKLYRVFDHSVYGDIYTTKEDINLSIELETEEQKGAFGLSIGVEECQGADCFVTNQFFAFRPDGTFLKFDYDPDISVKDIIWTDDKKTADRYLFYTARGCNQQKLDSNNVINPSLVSDDDLVVTGKVSKTGDMIYELKNQNHELYNELYSVYKEHYAGDYIYYVYPEEKKDIKSFDDFINSRPLFLWRDPFDRLICFNSEDLLPPFICEPIIYLYPETKQKISITLGKTVNVSDSSPEYKNGWNVIADPSGKILNLTDSRDYPYLFWEGWSLIFPVQNKGFVVKRNEVSNFLIETLPKLGLNKKEKEDFIEAWLPYFSDSPYYFITFLEQSAIDKIAPLQISPKPDTIIRILMDVKEIDEPIEIEEIEFKERPERIGFTVVEWGGLKR